MNKRFISLGLAGLISFSTVNTYAVTILNEENIITKDEKKVKIGKFNLDTKDINGEVKLNIPFISGLKDIKFQEEINNNIRQKALKEINEYKKMYEQSKDIDSSSISSEIIIDYDIKSSGDILSLVVNTYKITKGQANGQLTKDFYNINLKDASLIKLNNLFKNDKYIDIINNKIKNEINANKDLYFEMTKTDESEDIMGFTGITNDTNFFINNVGDLVICFDLYEIAPRATGYPEFSIYSYELKESLKDFNLSNSLISSNKYLVDNKNISIVYPSFNGFTDKEFEEKINSKIISSIKESLEDIKDENSELYFNYTLNFEDNEHISLTTNMYKYLANNANGENIVNVYNIDLKNKDFIKLDNIFKKGSNYKEIIDNYIKSEINKNPDLYFSIEDSKDSYNITGFKGINNNTKFFIDKDSNIVILFDQYEIAPRFMGMPEFKIPNNIVKDILK